MDCPTAHALSRPVRDTAGRAWTDALASWVDQERQARLIVDPELQIHWISASALDMIGDRRALQVTGGRLNALQTDRTRIIADLTRRATSTPTFSLIEDAGGDLWVIWAQSIARTAEPLVGLEIRRCRRAKDFSALVTAYRLTQAEGRIVEMMLGGAETQDIVDALNISTQTLRTHVKHAYSKLGVRSRGDLFTKAMDFVAP